MHEGAIEHDDTQEPTPPIDPPPTDPPERRAQGDGDPGDDTAA